MKSYEYILSLRDRVSGTMRTITGASLEATDKFTKLKEQTKALEQSTKDFGGSITTLRLKLDLLRSERDLIDPKELTRIRQYNTEIKGLTKEIGRLETINGSKLKNNIKAAFAEIPAILRNPVTLGAAAVGFAGKQAMGFDQGMAKINITAQLDKPSFDDLSRRVREVTKRNKADISVAPVGFEKIISQTGDAELSLSILDQALRGSKAGFTDLDTVSGALAQTLSIVGKENASAREVLDTFFAAKRVGAGEFKDFAQYMPGLIAGADTLGINYKNVAGIFAYMTGKGQSAERASVLMGNMFSVFGKKDITDKLALAGVDTFDKLSGKMRSTVDIFRDLNTMMAPMTEQQQVGLFDKIGLVDKEARSSFAIMAADVNKLSAALGDCNNAFGETDKALEFSQNSMQRSQELWNRLKNTGLELGLSLLPMINSGLTVLGTILDVAVPVIQAIFDATSWWIDALKEGNPIVWATTSALAAGLILWKAQVVWLKLTTLWNGFMTASTGVLSGAMASLRASFLATPWGVAIVGAAALVGGLATLLMKTNQSTAAYAKFNTELRRSRVESEQAALAATKAGIGTDERTAAIRRINEKYGEYLPNLLSEKASNNEIAVAMSLVNDQIENKIRAKFREAALDDINTKVLERENYVYESIMNTIHDPQKQIAAAPVVNRLLGDLARDGRGGLGKFRTEIGNLTGRNGANLGIVREAEIRNLAKLYETKQTEIALINARYSAPPPVTNNIYVTPVQQPWSAPSPWMQSTPRQQGWSMGGTPVTMTHAPGAEDKAPLTDASTAYDALMAKLAANTSGSGSGSGGSGGASQSVDLDKIKPQNTKGTTAYGAISAKIGSFSMQSLAKVAASVALPLSVASTELPNLALGAEFDSDNQARRERVIRPDKFCDTIEIHIANADNKGYDQIKGEIITIMEEVFDSYEA